MSINELERIWKFTAAYQEEAMQYFSDEVSWEIMNQFKTYSRSTPLFCIVPSSVSERVKYTESYLSRHLKS